MKKLFITIITIFSINCFSQKSADKTLGAWYMYSGNHKLSSNFQLKSLAHFRFFDTHKDLQQILLRFGGNYKFNKIISTSFGYAYLNTDTTFNINRGEINEHRIYEDFNIKNTINQLKIGQRFRVEHRFFENDTKHWIRYKFSLSHPIIKKLNSFIYNEVFFNFKGKLFAQNWFGGGLKYQLVKGATLTLGYQKIYNAKTDFDRLLFGISIKTNHFSK